MCGRYALVIIQELAKRFGIEAVNLVLTGNYNISPSQSIPVILNESPKTLTLVRWGLIPSWSKPDSINKYSMINTRSESIMEKPTFKRLFKRKRCLVVADSFYEWKKEGTKKHPYRILLKDESLFAFAGIWDSWKAPDGQEVQSCSIITTEPNALIKPIHDRMPVILPMNKEKEWLREDLDETAGLSLLRPYDAKKMKAYEISTLVNSPTNNIPSIIEPLKI
jgi:putative SOS response-associated peptidase YedK